MVEVDCDFWIPQQLLGDKFLPLITQCMEQYGKYGPIRIGNEFNAMAKAQGITQEQIILIARKIPVHSRLLEAIREACKDKKNSVRILSNANEMFINLFLEENAMLD